MLQAIDRAIRDVGGTPPPDDVFALTLADGEVAFANAGHTFPYVMRRSGTSVEKQHAATKYSTRIAEGGGLRDGPGAGLD